MTSLRALSTVEKPTGEELIARLVEVFPAIEEGGGDEVQLAKAAGLPIEVVQRALADADVLDALAAAHRAAEIDGTLLRAAAVKVALAMLRLTAKSLDAGEADLDDVANLLPKVFRIVEHADDIETRRKGGAMPVVHITFGGDSGGAIEVVEQVESNNDQPPADVAGADTAQVAEAAQRPASGPDINEVFEWVTAEGKR